MEHTHVLAGFEEGPFLSFRLGGKGIHLLAGYERGLLCTIVVDDEAMAKL